MSFFSYYQNILKKKISAQIQVTKALRAVKPLRGRVKALRAVKALTGGEDAARLGERASRGEAATRQNECPTGKTTNEKSACFLLT
jgi:hypothetical protein